MSFILDALRKSDQQRLRGAPPTLLTAPALVAAPRRPAYWVQGLIAAVLVIAGVLIGWLRPWQSELPAVPEPVLQASAPMPAIPQAPSAMPQVPTPPVQVSAVPPPAASVPAVAAPTQVDAAVATAQPTATTATAGVGPQSAPRAPAGSSVAAVKTPETRAPARAVPQETLTLRDLPLSVREELPEMRVLLHMYSPRREKRFVTINDRTLQEGESPAPGVTLDEITPDGMILSFKGYRFRRGVQ